MRVRENKFPPSRVESLYKDFRYMRDLNPDGFKANLNTWKEFFVKDYFCSNSSIVYHSGGDFLQDLIVPKYGTPKSIDVVLESLKQENQIIPIQQFYDRYEYERNQKTGLFGYIRWVGFKLYRKDNTEFRKNDNNSEQYLNNISFIVVDKLRENYNIIYQILKQNILKNAVAITDIVFDLQHFVKLSGIQDTLTHSGENNEDINVMLAYMEYEKKIITRDDQIVKVIDPSLSTALINNFTCDITENDKRIVNLNIGICNIQLQIEKLEKELAIFNHRENEKDYKMLSDKVKERYRKAKLLTTKYLIKLLDYLANLKYIKSQIDECVTNQLVFDTLSNSNEMIKSINDYIGSVDKVEDLLDEIKEESERTQEISDALTSNETAGNMERFDDEIEIELQKLEERQEREKESKEGEIAKAALESNDPNVERLLNELNSLEIENTDIGEEQKAEKKDETGEMVLNES